MVKLYKRTIALLERIATLGDNTTAMEFIFDQAGPEQHPKDPVIGCSIWGKALCIDCGKAGRCRYEGAARQEVA